MILSYRLCLKKRSEGRRKDKFSETGRDDESLCDFNSTDKVKGPETQAFQRGQTCQTCEEVL